MTLDDYRLEVLRLFEQYEISRRDQETIDALARLLHTLDNEPHTPMSTTYPLHILRRWAAGKRITKAQLAALHEDGYITTTDNGETLATTRGAELLKNSKEN